MIAQKLQEALEDIIWYDGHCEWLRELADKIEKADVLFENPFESAEWHEERHVIFMLLVGMFGEWGTSIRSGWITEKEECVAYIRSICDKMDELEAF